jgi:hypothetical protein
MLIDPRLRRVKGQRYLRQLKVNVRSELERQAVKQQAQEESLKFKGGKL